MVVGEVAGLAVGMGELLHRLQQHIVISEVDEVVVGFELSRLLEQMDVGEVEGLADELSEVSHWAERRKVIGEVTGLGVELRELSN